MIYPRIKYSESWYSSVAANSEERSSGVTPAEGEHLSIHRIVANGADPNAYVALIWDRDGTEQKIFLSTKGDVDLTYESNDQSMHFTGDGLKKLQLVVINNNDSSTPFIGGHYEVIEVD